jgi:hypothetical protein
VVNLVSHSYNKYVCKRMDMNEPMDSDISELIVKQHDQPQTAQSLSVPLAEEIGGSQPPLPMPPSLLCNPPYLPLRELTVTSVLLGIYVRRPSTADHLAHTPPIQKCRSIPTPSLRPMSSQCIIYLLLSCICIQLLPLTSPLDIPKLYRRLSRLTNLSLLLRPRPRILLPFTPLWRILRRNNLAFLKLERRFDERDQEFQTI